MSTDVMLACHFCVLTWGHSTINFLRTTVMLTVYCDLRALTLCILNSRTSLPRAIGNPKDSLQFVLTL